MACKYLNKAEWIRRKRSLNKLRRIRIRRITKRIREGYSGLEKKIYKKLKPIGQSWTRPTFIILIEQKRIDNCRFVLCFSEFNEVELCVVLADTDFKHFLFEKVTNEIKRMFDVSDLIY